MKPLLLLVQVSTCCATLAPHAAAAAEYVIDPARTLLVVKTQKAGPASAMAHNHVIAAQEFSGMVTFDASTPESAGIRMEVNTRSLVVDDPQLRKRFGETSVLSEKDRAEVAANMRGADQLDIARFPTMGFQSTRVAKQADGRFLITGNLTLHGTTRQVTFPATVESDSQSFRGKGSLVFKQSSFGWKPYSAFFGAVRNADEVTLHLDIVATRRGEPPANP